jgi:hypothetical protein
MAQRSDVRRVAAAHEDFLATPNAPLPVAVRPVVAESRRRSQALGVNPSSSAVVDLNEAELAEYRAEPPLAPMMPLIRRLLTEDADEAGHIVAIGDARGRLLRVEGHHRLRTRAEQMFHRLGRRPRSFGFSAPTCSTPGRTGLVRNQERAAGATATANSRSDDHSGFFDEYPLAYLNLWPRRQQ